MKLSTFEAMKLAKDDTAIQLGEEALRKCQQLLLEIADDITAVCDDNGINYSLSGGTALGAVRHQGMIPWDDDVDLNMFRADIDRFLRAFRERFGDKYWIHTPEETKHYGLLFIRVRLKGTVMRGREDQDTDECGIAVDIFPYENTYDLKALRILHGVLCLGMKFALSCRKTWQYRALNLRLMENNPEGKKAILMKCALGAVCSLFSVDAWTHGAIRCFKMCGNDRSRYVTIPAGRKQFFGEMYRRDATEATSKVPFAGRAYRLTDDYDNYLRIMYGDYMQIPPPEKRERHIIYELDFGRR